MFHKIAHNNVRPLLKSIMPPLVYNIHNTRSNDIYKNFPRVNEKYYNSFIPHLTRVWNSLDKAIRNEFDINVFKVNIKDKLKPSRYRHYKYGNKYINTLMCQLRVGRTYLKADSFSIGLSESDRCECGQKETISHNFSCKKYQPQQNILFGKITEIIPKFSQYLLRDKVSLMLYGYNLASKEFDCRNISITFAVQAYITSTKHFIHSKAS